MLKQDGAKAILKGKFISINIPKRFLGKRFL